MAELIAFKYSKLKNKAAPKNGFVALKQNFKTFWALEALYY
jgi:hypothetical protein